MIHEPQSYRVVLVCDPVSGVPNILKGQFNREIDRPWSTTAEHIRSALEELCGPNGVIQYQSLSAFIDNASKHQNDVVFPYWFGERSRSRHGLLPAVCEAYGIHFVGADAFTKIVCNDKELSKVLARNAGLQAPEALQLRDESDLQRLSLIQYPAVVKPNFEGTSLGIASTNLVRCSVDAAQIARQLLSTLSQPVIVEQFIAGREVSICMVGNRDSMQIVEAVGWEVNGQETFLNDRLFSFAFRTQVKVRRKFDHKKAIRTESAIDAHSIHFIKSYRVASL